MMDSMKNVHELWPGGPLYGGDPVGGDPLVLADFAMGLPGKSVCDLGCGSGILLLLLGIARPELALYGAELRPGAAEECRRNAERNGLADRCVVFTGDLRSCPFPAGSMDLVLSNPPYFSAVPGGVSPDPDRAAMRTESASLPELCAVAAALLSPAGAFCLIHRRERMGDVFAALAGAGLFPRRLRFFGADPGRGPGLFLCEAGRGVCSEPITEPPLYQRRADGTETEEYRKICHWEA